MVGVFRPIEDYALIGDARSAALVSSDGSIDWLCWPRFDSAAIFAALLDAENGGHCHLRPVGSFEYSRKYEDSSNVLVTTFRSATGTAKLTDCFFATTEALKRGRAIPQAMVVRRVDCLDGTIEIDVEVDPRIHFGLKQPQLKRRGPGSWTFALKEGLVHVACDEPLVERQGHLGSQTALSAGESLTLVLALNGTEPAIFPPIQEASELIAETNGYWKAWAQRITYEGPHRDAVIRSALVLKLLTFAPSGAVIAAPTTSLPERIGASYNWDYRFCWLRDASDTVEALLGLSMAEEAKAFLQWLLHTTRLTFPKLQIMYSILGNPGLPERQLPWLSGYENSQPVRIGNAAHTQLQLDVNGEVIRAAAIAYPRGTRLSRDEKSFLRGLANFVLKNWQLPDSGIWETRGPPRHFLHSRVMCWVALDRVSRLAEAGHLDLDHVRMQAAADEVKATVQQRGFNKDLDSYTSTLDGTGLDASVLTLPLVGFEEATSPAMAATIQSLKKNLMRDGLVLRHQNGETECEGAFLLCSFWLVQCLALQGNLEEAAHLFDELCRKANDVGLYSEEIDTESGRFLGNFPQAFTHIGLINAALALERARTNGAEKAGME